MTLNKTDGNPLMVSGIIARSGVDRDGQFLDPDWLAGALRDWMNRGGTVTTNFDHKPVAICTHLFTDDGNESFQGEVTVYDAGTAELIEADALKGLSIAIADATIHQKDGTKIIGGRINEVSLLDHDFWEAE